MRSEMKRLYKATTLAVVVALLFGLAPLMHPVYADPNLPLPRIPICGDQDGSEVPFSFHCPDFAPSTNVKTYQVPGTGEQDFAFDFIFREATLNNELGFFKVDSASG